MTFLNRPGPSQRLPGPVRSFLLFSLLLTALCAATEVVAKLVFHLSAAYTSPLLPGRFEDLVLVCPRFAFYHHFEIFTAYPQFPYMYPAPVADFYEVFCSVPQHRAAVFEAFILLTFLVAAAFFGRTLVRRGLSLASTVLLLATSLILSYPLWFELRQANMEIIVCILVGLALTAFFHDRLHLAAALLGIAASMKFFPLVYLGLLIAKRKYRPVVTALATMGAFSLVSLWFLYPDVLVSWRQTSQGLQHFRSFIMLHEIAWVTGFDHSLFGLYKRVALTLPPENILGHALSAYLVTATIVGVLLFWFVIRRLPPINQVLCLTIASILLPPTSFDYTLMHLYFPWALLVLLALAAQRTAHVIPGLQLSFVALAILTSPESEFFHHGLRFGGQIKAVTLVLLFLVSLRYPFQQSGTQPTATLA